MRVVFLEDVEGVAHGGDVKEVKNGFARNYLIPRGMAVLAHARNVGRLQHEQSVAQAKEDKFLAAANEAGQVEMHPGGRVGLPGREPELGEGEAAQLVQYREEIRPQRRSQDIQRVR